MNSLINDCVNIENNIKQINIINENLEKSNNFDDSKIEFNISEEEINNFLGYIQKLINIDLNEKKFFKDSSIIKNEINKQNNIINWIKEKVNKNDINFELIFKMSENGSKSEDFHKYCDDKGPTLIIIKTTKNKIFGGFTPLSWKDIKGNKKYDESDQTFIFSLNLMKKYDMIDKDNKKAIYCTKDYGPCFGDSDFSLEENMKNGKTYANNTCNFLSNNNLELTGGKGNSENFEVEEFEFYKVS